jgi:hypothetical protein
MVRAVKVALLKRLQLAAALALTTAALVFAIGGLLHGRVGPGAAVAAATAIGHAAAPLTGRAAVGAQE